MEDTSHHDDVSHKTSNIKCSGKNCYNWVMEILNNSNTNSMYRIDVITKVHGYKAIIKLHEILDFKSFIIIKCRQNYSIRNYNLTIVTFKDKLKISIDKMKSKNL